MRASKIHQLLEDVSKILHNFVPDATLIDGRVWDSVFILCSTLQTAAYFIYRAFTFDFKFTDLFNGVPARLLADSFSENGWCPRERKIINDLVEGDKCVLFLCAQLDRRDDQTRHSSCNEKMCYAYQVDNATYKTRHVRPDCRCEFIGFGRSQTGGAQSAISKAVMKVTSQESRFPKKLNSAPMILYQNGELRIVEISPMVAEAGRLIKPFGNRYVAISHVWADGMGNPHSNDLPRCQVERLSVSQAPESNILFPSFYFHPSPLCMNQAARFLLTNR